MWSDLDTNLTEIQLPRNLPQPWRGQSWWTPPAITELATQCPKLTRADLSRCHTVTDDTITTLARHYPNLTNLKRDNLTDDTITRFAIHCPNLVEFYLGGCGGVTETSLLNLARCCPRVRENMMSPEWNLSAPVPVDIDKIQAIENRSHLSSLRIKRFWRDVCYNPVYRHARKRIQQVTESE